MVGDHFDVIVIGGGHAGCEAALAAARSGVRTLLITLNLDMVAHMPCNCSIGGPGKSHLVAEIDALGGEMARVADQTMTHVRLLNSSRGPAVRAVRAQADKALYRATMKATLEGQEGLALYQDMVTGLARNGERGFAVATRTGCLFTAQSVVVATGTFLNGLIHIGDVSYPAGRAGEEASTDLAQSLQALGIRFQRFKTGTVPRIHLSSIDLSRVGVQPSASAPLRLSASPVQRPPRVLLPCYVTRTNSRTHDILRAAFDRSALVSGRITGTGPRYCPSIEAKLLRFPDRSSHTVFLEQEGWDTEEVYVQGLSNSMPRDVQLAMLHSMDGLEECVMLRPGYAIEYDCLDPRQLVHSLEVRELAGLYCAGQINGTSGYEEAAAQGIITGINAAHAVMGRAPVMLPRVSSYIGVMVDDLTTRGLDEPYRMLTGRAEMRLALGVRTARERLSNAGLAPDRQRHGVVSDDAAAVAAEMQRLSAVQAAEADSALAQVQGGGSYQEAAAGSLPPMRFPERLWSAFEETARFRPYETRTSGCHSEGLSIPGDFDYRITPLRLEARERLGRARPTTVGQAARLTGICAADVATLTMLLRSRK